MSMSAVSLFSGAGGMDVGVANAGFAIRLANDVDPDACATYRLNHGSTILEGDLRDFGPSLKAHRGTDLVFGGPPCQGFSVAGKMDPNDARSQLLTSYFDVIDELKPRAFICENVKALAVLSKWERIRAGMMARTSDDYHTAMVVLNSSAFGVPQSRERMFFVGLRRSASRGPIKDALEKEISKQKRLSPSLGDVVKKLGRAGTITNKRTCAAKITYAKNPVLRRSAYAGMLFNGAGRPLAASGVSSTLAASMGGNKTPIVDEAEIFDGASSFVEAYHKELLKGGASRQGDAPSRLRRLTVDECLAIQTFPADYKLSGRQSAQYRQLGNAVPCAMAEVVATSLRFLMLANCDRLRNAA